MKFTELSLPEDIQRGIRDAGFSDLMPVQEETLKQSLKGKDVAVQSQTGTGKTAAFLITIFYHFLNKNSGKNRKALIVTPTRELAIQIEQDAKLLGKHLNLSIGSFYGGVGYFQQEKLLKQGTDMIIGTPGRLLDFNDQRKVSFKDIGFLVIDEADRMFDMGFLPDVRKILKHVPEKRQTLLFSATFPSEIKDLASQTLTNPKYATLSLNCPVHTVSHALYPVPHHLKTKLVLSLLKSTNTGSVLIFTRTKYRAQGLAGKIESIGYKVTSLHSNRTQNQRQAAINGFKDGTFQIMVATDIAARGLDVEKVSHVINFDMPNTSDAYIHRIGRTGRAENRGDAFTLTTPEDSDMVRTLEKIMGKPLRREKLPEFNYHTPPPVPRVQASRPARRSFSRR
jgi:ATP-dependent RNA helicase RhlE